MTAPSRPVLQIRLVNQADDYEDYPPASAPDLSQVHRKGSPLVVASSCGLRTR